MRERGVIIADQHRERRGLPGGGGGVSVCSLLVRSACLSGLGARRALAIARSF